MKRLDELLVELRKLVNDSRDDNDPTFFWAIDHGAHLAAAFDELDKALTDGDELPSDWQR